MALSESDQSATGLFQPQPRALRTTSHCYTGLIDSIALPTAAIPMDSLYCSCKLTRVPLLTASHRRFRAGCTTVEAGWCGLARPARWTLLGATSVSSALWPAHQHTA